MNMTQVINNEANPVNVRVCDSKKRNVQLAYKHAVTVEASAYVEAIKVQPIGKYPFQYVGVRADSGHEFRVSLYYTFDNVSGGYGPPSGDNFVLTINGSRGVSDWAECKGDYVSVYIYNDSAEDHSYDVYLYGVR